MNVDIYIINLFLDRNSIKEVDHECDLRSCKSNYLCGVIRISRGKVGVSKMQVEMKGPNILKI